MRPLQATAAKRSVIVIGALRDPSVPQLALRLSFFIQVAGVFFLGRTVQRPQGPSGPQESA